MVLTVVSVVSVYGYGGCANDDDDDDDYSHDLYQNHDHRLPVAAQNHLVTNGGIIVEQLRQSSKEEEGGIVHLNLDAAHMGVGGDDSWSPAVHGEFLVPPTKYEFELTLSRAP